MYLYFRFTSRYVDYGIFRFYLFESKYFYPLCTGMYVMLPYVKEPTLHAIQKIRTVTLAYGSPDDIY